MEKIKIKEIVATFICPVLNIEATGRVQYSYTEHNSWSCCGNSYEVYADIVQCSVCGKEHEFRFDTL